MKNEVSFIDMILLAAKKVSMRSPQMNRYENGAEQHTHPDNAKIVLVDAKALTLCLQRE